MSQNNESRIAAAAAASNNNEPPPPPPEYDPDDPKSIECKCGADNCRKVLFG